MCEVANVMVIGNCKYQPTYTNPQTGIWTQDLQTRSATNLTVKSDISFSLFST